MKIAFFISEDYSFTFPLLEKILQELSQKHQVAGIILIPDILIGYTGIKIPLKYLEIFGIITTVKLIVKKIKDKFRIYQNYLSQKTQFYTFRQMALHNDITYLEYSSPNQKEVVDWVKKNQVDIIIIFIGHILKKDIIESPRCCIINKHGSLLPSNRGVLPVFWAMLNDENMGYSLHKVNEKLDSGDVLYQKEFKKQNISLFDWYQKIYSDAPVAILTCIEKLENNKNPAAIINTEVIPSYNTLPTRKDVKKFYKKGLKII